MLSVGRPSWNPPPVASVNACLPAFSRFTPWLNPFSSRLAFIKPHEKLIDQTASNFPNDFEGLILESVFTSPTPIGEHLDWDGTGTTRPYFGITIPVDVSTTKAVDELAGDCDITTGRVLRTGGTLNFILTDE